ncbi:hypothetical protein [Thermus scotoductus]|uniref:hypothetical protein n=1 Tax=Thermus scotoductus TaxID=37636 RepID=UPI000F7E52C5|nr:hypothetical protein [Thermus scotoductus]RTG95095.1 hypothetical protein CSW48_06725 [Thermus scotoductus]
MARAGALLILALVLAGCEPPAARWEGEVYQRGIEAAFLLATGEGALAWAKEFGVPVPGDAGEGGGRGA